METTPPVRQTVLIVDDTPVNIEILSSILEAGHEVLFATSGRDALELVASQIPDLILLDIMMPEMDGYEVCKRLKADPKTHNVPVIFITALSEEADEARGLEIGAIDYISRPMSAPIVKARVRNHLQLKRFRDILEDLSARDGLTGIANRRRLDEFLDQEWLRGGRNHSPLSVCLIDIDFFKRFNDCYGHAAGDDCLRRVASALAGVSRRPADLVARYGGEEFVCALPDTDAAGAALLADKFRDAVSALGIPHADSTVAEHVTISGGVATAIPTAESTATQLLEAADRMLYQAKEAGRNRVWSDEPVPRAPQIRGPTSRVKERLNAAGTVLIVDDNPTSRAVLKGYVEHEGYSARQAADGHAALTQVARKAPDIILMDATMPGMDALECTRRLKTDPATKDIPIIMVGPRAEASDIVVGLEAGADEYLTKPLEATEFSVRLHSVFEHLRNRKELRHSYEIRSEQARSLALVLGLAQMLGGTDDLDWALEQTIAAAVELTGCRRVSIMLPDANRQFLYIAKAVGVDEQVIANTKVAIGESIAGRVFETHEALVVNTEQDLKAERHVCDSDHFASIPLLCAVLGSPKRVVGVLNLTKRTGEEGFESREAEFINLIASIAGTAIDDILARATRDQARDSIMLAFAKLAERRDSETGRHVQRVTQYCLILADELRKSEKFASEIDDTFMYNLERAAPLHDIGKVAIPDQVLLKPGQLTRSEMEVMKTHAQIGAETIRHVRHRAPDFDILKMAEDIAHFHHEWYDGTGYPRCLKGDAIPLSCRIAGLADVYDALTRKRVYKDAVGHDEATTIILGLSGTQFDPSIVESFLQREDDFRRLSAELADTPKPSHDGTRAKAEALMVPFAASETQG